MTRSRRTLRALITLAAEHRLGAAVLAIVVVTAALLLLAIRPLFSLVSTPAIAHAEPPAAAPATFSEDLRLALDRFRGRSLFFIPAPPPPPAPVVRDPVERIPPGPPARYGGPALIALMSDVAWFADGRRLAVGDNSDGDLAVLEISPPWYARVAWAGGEYTVTLFDRTGLTSSITSPSAAAPSPKPSSSAPSSATRPPEPTTEARSPSVHPTSDPADEPEPADEPPPEPVPDEPVPPPPPPPDVPPPPDTPPPSDPRPSEPQPSDPQPSPTPQ